MNLILVHSQAELKMRQIPQSFCLERCGLTLVTGCPKEWGKNDILTILSLRHLVRERQISILLICKSFLKKLYK